MTEEKVELGRHLFYEPMLSGNSTYSCASCHKQSLAFTDGLAQSIGSTGGQHPRSSMSLANVVYNASFGWRDRTWSLESQMVVPMHNEHPVEMGLKGQEAEVIETIPRRRRLCRALSHGVSRRPGPGNARRTS